METLNKINLEKDFSLFDYETLSSIESSEPIFIVSSAEIDSDTQKNSRLLCIEIALRKCERVGTFSGSN